MQELSGIISVIKDLPQDELKFLKEYLEAHLANDFKDLFHKFMDAQIDFIKEEFE